jgi:nucleoside 2-deoxyribosyltransferase
MKIMICGSMTFAKEMIEAKETLDKLGYDVIIPTDAHDVVKGTLDNDDLEADYRYCVEQDVMRKHYKLIEQSDAVLILNHAKNDTEGYIGTATLMELGLAHHLNKKIFLLNSLPHHSKHRWAHEVRIMQPVILDGKLDKIKDFL